MDKDDFKNALRLIVVVVIILLIVLALALASKKLTETPTKQTEILFEQIEDTTNLSE